jgi:4'-phosphopantetheinyl transferase
MMLQVSEVHIWHVSLDRPPATLSPLLPLLSPDEQQKADRFRFDKDRTRYILARGLLRTVLSRYLAVMDSAIAPHQIEFTYTAKGKPGLANSPIAFNVSHSHQLALFAIAARPRIGVDLEYVRPIEAASLAQRFFSAQEAAMITALSGAEQQRVFFRGWTQKEAYLKATGDGLVGLESVEVALEPPMRILKINGDPQAAAHWLMTEIIVPDYVAAIATEGAPPTLQHFSI